ncbi:MAG: hypothetical protein JWO32_2335 [Bacteroidetes bacterium]|nr:hypothetical protein [Bacteroidota bacterium]
MNLPLIDKTKFTFQYLTNYATYLLSNRLEEFVTVSIRFCREVDLPMLKPLSKFSEKELVNLSMESNRLMLEAIAKNSIAEYIEDNTKKWISNKLEVIDKNEILAEDLTLAFFIRRKTFAHFLDSYTKNVVLQKFIIAETDVYTTQEELISYKTYLGLHK